MCEAILDLLVLVELSSHRNDPSRQQVKKKNCPAEPSQFTVLINHCFLSHYVLEQFVNTAINNRYTTFLYISSFLKTLLLKENFVTSINRKLVSSHKTKHDERETKEYYSLLPDTAAYRSLCISSPKRSPNVREVLKIHQK